MAQLDLLPAKHHIRLTIGNSGFINNSMFHQDLI
jgi:hypothetical protein